MDLKKQLIALFKLKEDADEAGVAAQAQTLAQRVEASQGKWARAAQALKIKPEASAEDLERAVQSLRQSSEGPVSADRYQYLSREFASFKASVSKERAEARVDGAVKAGRIQPSQREWALEYASQDPEGFRAFLDKQPVLVGPSGLAGKNPGGDPGRSLNTPQTRIAEMFGNSAEDLKKYASRDP